MSYGSASLDVVAATWLAAVGRACWQGSLAIGLVWALCRLSPRLSGRVQCWLWRLAYLKLLAAFLCAGSVVLPVLPRAWSGGGPPAVLSAPATDADRPITGYERAGGSQSYGQATEVAAAKAQSPPSRAEFSVREGGLRAFPASTSVDGRWNWLPPARSHPAIRQSSSTAARAIWGVLLPSTQPRAPSTAFPRWLMMLWLLGVAGCGGQMLRGWRDTRRLRRRAEAIHDEDRVAACRDLCRRLGIRRPPELLAAPGPGCALLIGVARPAVVLPGPTFGVCPPSPRFDADQLRLMLGHELAHLKRRDLLWAWLPSLCRALFFFHPLVWLAEEEWRVAHEIACDEQAVLSTAASPARYGAMLLDALATQHPSPARLFTAAVAESYATVRRRLVAVRQVRPIPPRRRSVQGAFLAAIAVAGIVPWRLTARTAPAASPPLPHRSERTSLDPRPVNRGDERPLLVASSRSSAVASLPGVGRRVSGVGGEERAAGSGSRSSDTRHPGAKRSALLPAAQAPRERARPTSAAVTHDGAIGADPAEGSTREGGPDAPPRLAEADPDSVDQSLPVEEPLAGEKAPPEEEGGTDATVPPFGKPGIKRPLLYPPKSIAFLADGGKEDPFRFDVEGQHLKSRGAPPLDPTVIKKLLSQGADMSAVKRALAGKLPMGRSEKGLSLEHLKWQEANEQIARRKKKLAFERSMEQMKKQAADEEMGWREKGLRFEHSKRRPVEEGMEP